MNYEKDVRIDETALDIEWLEQPTLMRKYTKHLAEMQKVEDTTKIEMELIWAELDIKIRKNPEEFGLTKITETAIKNNILILDEYKEVNEAYIDAIFNKNIAKGVVNSIQQKKDALENLVKLHGQSYFAGPSIPRNLTEKVEEKQKKANLKIRMERKK
jgi:hypothetical protein